MLLISLEVEIEHGGPVAVDLDSWLPAADRIILQQTVSSSWEAQELLREIAWIEWNVVNDISTHRFPMAAFPRAYVLVNMLSLRLRFDALEARLSSMSQGIAELAHPP